MEKYKLNDLEKFLRNQERKFVNEKGLSKKQIIPLLTGLCSASATIPLEGLPEILSMLMMGGCGVAWYKEEEKYKLEMAQHITNEVLEYIENSEEYLICQNLYNYFLEETAELFTKLSAEKDPIILGLLHRDLLHNGVFSKDTEFKYHSYEKDFGIHYDTLGARICSGTGVCRHIAKNAVDLYRLLGYTAAYAQVKTINEKSLLKNEKILNILNPAPNHAIAGVVGQDGKFIIDTTNYLLGNISENEKIAKSLIGEKTYYFNQKKIHSKNNEYEKENYEKFQKAPRKIITMEEYQEKAEEKSSIIRTNYIPLANYLGKIEPIVYQIANYEKLLSQYQDKNKKHKVRQR